MTYLILQLVLVYCLLKLINLVFETTDSKCSTCGKEMITSGYGSKERFKCNNHECPKYGELI
jgi:hypothetical protein